MQVKNPSLAEYVPEIERGASPWLRQPVRVGNEPAIHCKLPTSTRLHPVPAHISLLIIIVLLLILRLRRLDRARHCLQRSCLWFLSCRSLLLHLQRKLSTASTNTQSCLSWATTPALLYASPSMTSWPAVKQPPLSTGRTRGHRIIATIIHLQARPPTPSALLRKAQNGGRALRCPLVLGLVADIRSTPHLLRLSHTTISLPLLSNSSRQRREL